MLQVWRDGALKGKHRRFHRSIVRRMPPYQTPNYLRAGKVDPEFEAQTPFTV
jgi:metacaspase-1